MAEPVEWTYDDPSIPHGEVLYRRVPKDEEPKKHYFDFATTVDRISGEKCLGKGAFSLTTPDKTHAEEGPSGAGLSVQIESLMRLNGIPTSDLVDWETHGVGRFHADDVRRGLEEDPTRGRGGVVAFEDPTDDVLGKAHGLLRTQSPDSPRSEWSDIRSKLLSAAIWYDSDPGYETPEVPD